MWRPATAADDESFVNLCAELNREDPGSDPVPPEHMRRTLATLRAEPARGRACALELAGKVAGYALLISFWSNELGGEVCNVDEIYVQPEHRRQGHAGALMRALADGSGPWPRKPVAIELEVSPDNARAMAFYAALGFVPVRNRQLRLMPKG